MAENTPAQALSSQYSPFLSRHIGPSMLEQQEMLAALGHRDLESFVGQVIPEDILERDLSTESVPECCSEVTALEELHLIASKNEVKRSLIGLGYYGTFTPSAVQRQVFENPSWYTAYTPYQAEISQGRLEALFNFQTLISELTGLPIANASLLDESTAAAEAMNVSFTLCKQRQARCFFVDSDVLPQTLEVLHTRAEPLNIELIVSSPEEFSFDENVFGALIQLPGRSGRIWNPQDFIEKAHQIGALVTAAIDPLAQVLLKPVGQLGCDIAVGSAQRFGVPIGFGGPHAAFFATREEFKRQIPGRLVGQSLDIDGKPALRLALQTREQHIRRDKATSNICTAQVLLAVISSFYAIHHGPDGLQKIAKKVMYLRQQLELALRKLGYQFDEVLRFDTIEVMSTSAPQVHKLANLAGFNLRVLPLGSTINESKGFGISFDELTDEKEVQNLIDIIAGVIGRPNPSLASVELKLFPQDLSRTEPWLQQSVFNKYHSETELMRYINRLVSRDFSLVHGMIPLGSCTMKLNAATELVPVSWKQFADIHPFAPDQQTKGYQILISDLEKWLSELTGFAKFSLQPNAGSQGEFAGLLVIRAWHQARGNFQRDVCLIPTSAHGTNPASSVMAGLRVVPVECDEMGNIDLNDLQNKVAKYADKLAAFMVTYPSTHGVFEPNIRQICDLIHSQGGQVYLDGANLNAQVGFCLPGLYGVDVCHINLHKTFCIPHGGGGPGIGPIGVAEHLLPFLPGHCLVDLGGSNSISAVASAPWGSAGILPITWMYLRMMGAKGLRNASAISLLSANYIAYRLDQHFPVLFKGVNGFVAHECILDVRQFKKKSGIEVDDIAKRLMDYGFHAPTVSWPVAGTLMVEPTESECLDELNRFCNSMIAIKKEIDAIECGDIDSLNNPLKRAPHSIETVCSDDWDRPYSRNQAAFPLPNQQLNKFWPAVSRINNAYGDRNLICTCLEMASLDVDDSLSDD